MSLSSINTKKYRPGKEFFYFYRILTIIWLSWSVWIGNSSLHALNLPEGRPHSVAESSTHHRPIETPVYGYEVIHVYPHDSAAFTQGLVFHDGFLYESTGTYGGSTLREVQLETGSVLRSLELPRDVFGEGLTLYENHLIQLTWTSGVGFIYDRETFHLVKGFSYKGEGWGITHDGKRLIVSDGTSTLSFRNPDTFEEVGRIEVHDKGTEIDRLNELEYINGEIYANVWKTSRIAIISPETGQVTAWIDLEGLLKEEDRSRPVDVLNGIAYDADRDRLFVTGKYWPKLFEIKPVPLQQKIPGEG